MRFFFSPWLTSPRLNSSPHQALLALALDAVVEFVSSMHQAPAAAEAFIYAALVRIMVRRLT